MKSERKACAESLTPEAKPIEHFRIAAPHRHGSGAGEGTEETVLGRGAPGDRDARGEVVLVPGVEARAMVPPVRPRSNSTSGLALEGMPFCMFSTRS